MCALEALSPEQLLCARSLLYTAYGNYKNRKFRSESFFVYLYNAFLKIILGGWRLKPAQEFTTCEVTGTIWFLQVSDITSYNSLPGPSSPRKTTGNKICGEKTEAVGQKKENVSRKEMERESGDDTK